ncbi:MAG: hypothetical protein LC775_13235, partial [Acidobacteria bacterium]|nr:hypothetical protein [Acidobacteriota bacterium]
CLRRVIALGIEGLGLVLTIVHRIRIRVFFWSQRRLKRRYGICSDTPLVTFGPELELLIDRAAERAGQGAKFAWTSGSTAKPKRILYTRGRLRKVKLAYVDFIARCCWSLHIKRSSLYVFSSYSTDDSLTSMLLEEKSVPHYFSSLQAPYRIHSCPAMQSLVSDYGATAVRLWILTIANPGILYTTNPSTLSIFLDDLATEWQRSALLIKDWCRKPEAFDNVVHAIANRLESRGSHTRRYCDERDPAVIRGVRACGPSVHLLGGRLRQTVSRSLDGLSSPRSLPACPNVLIVDRNPGNRRQFRRQ